MPCFCSSERSFGEKFRAQFLLFWGVLGYTGLLVSMESDHVLRETQLKIVYAVVAVFVCYYAITALIPWGVHIIQIELDKRRVINVLRDEIHDTTNAESQLKEYKHAKVQPECIANIAKRKPNFVLSTNPIPAGIASKDRDRSSKAVEKLAAPSSTFSTQRNSQPRFNLASASSEQTSLNRQERDLVDPRDLANIAPRLNSGSEEDRFQRPAKRGTTLNGIVDVNDQRKLKEQQDREYRKSEERDRERLRAEQAKMVF